MNIRMKIEVGDVVEHFKEVYVVIGKGYITGSSSMLVKLVKPYPKVDYIKVKTLYDDEIEQLRITR